MSAMEKPADISVDISYLRCLGKDHIIWQKYPVAESADLMESPYVYNLGSGETCLFDIKTRNNNLMYN